MMVIKDDDKNEDCYDNCHVPGLVGLVFRVGLGWV